MVIKEEIDKWKNKLKGTKLKIFEKAVTSKKFKTYINEDTEYKKNS